MSGGRMPSSPGSASKGFSSTPLKVNQKGDCCSPAGLDDGVLSDDEDTFSLLSPIYHDSFDSDDSMQASPAEQQTSPHQGVHSRSSSSPVRCELPKTPSVQMLAAALEPADIPPCSQSPLSAWETWLVNKAKEDRLKLDKKAEEVQQLKEKKELQVREQERKKMVVEEKIQEWLKMKREQERHKQLEKQSKEEEEKQRRQEKKREIEQKAQQKYKDWLHKKNQEKLEMEKKEKEKAALEEEQQRERRQRAEETFKQWLAKEKRQARERSRASPRSPCYSTGPYDKSYPAPSFYNPIPWKPIHVPPPETSQNKKSDKKSQKQRRCQTQTPGTALSLRNSASAGQKR